MTEEEKRARPTDFPWFRTDKAPIQAWECEGILCAIAEGFAALNGYIRIPEDHVWRVFDSYDDLPVDVHGGLTFGPQPPSEEQTFAEVPGPDGRPVTMPARPGRSWDEVQGWIGFDTKHAWDYWPDEELEKAGYEWTDATRMVREIERAYPERADRWTRTWTVESLIQEVNDLARQAAHATADPAR